MENFNPLPRQPDTFPRTEPNLSTPPTNFLLRMMHFNIILTSATLRPRAFFSSGFPPPEPLYVFPFSPIRATFPAYFCTRFDKPNTVWNAQLLQTHYAVLSNLIYLP